MILINLSYLILDMGEIHYQTVNIECKHFEKFVMACMKNDNDAPVAEQRHDDYRHILNILPYCFTYFEQFTKLFMSHFTKPSYASSITTNSQLSPTFPFSSAVKVLF